MFLHIWRTVVSSSQEKLRQSAINYTKKAGQVNHLLHNYFFLFYRVTKTGLTWGWIQIHFLIPILLCFLKNQMMDKTQKPSNPEYYKTVFYFSECLLLLILAANTINANNFFDMNSPALKQTQNQPCIVQIVSTRSSFKKVVNSLQYDLPVFIRNYLNYKPM
jgi:hypothetical protein